MSAQDGAAGSSAPSKAAQRDASLSADVQINASKPVAERNEDVLHAGTLGEPKVGSKDADSGGGSSRKSVVGRDSPATRREKRRKAHRRMMEAQTFEEDLSSMDEINHLNEQRERISALLKNMEQKVSEHERP